MVFSNYHTHTVFCDGTDTAQELVLEAIRLGCPEIGFSGHSYTWFDESYCMSAEKTKIYCETVNALKEEYKDKIRILLGIEQDFYSDADTKAYDYVIGSVHYVQKNGEFLPVDDSAESQLASVNRLYGGDFYAFIEDYYRTVSALYEKTHCDIIGHFDLIAKFNEGNILFSEEHPRYSAASKAALYSLLKSPALFELNTGAVSRGYKRLPYPAPPLLAILKAQHAPLILSSDCHAKENLLFGFDRYGEIAGRTHFPARHTK